MRRQEIVLAGIVLLVLLCATLWQFQWDIQGIIAWIEVHRMAGMAVYLLFLIASVVLLPFSSLPLLPVAARVFGVWTTGILNTVGWWIGCLIAFQIARMGRRVLERFTSLEAVDRLERKIPPDLSFAGIVLLRMTLPVDGVSFALGLLKHLSFRTHAIASFIGIIPFAFVWSYAGGELGRGQILTALLIFGGMTVAVLGMRRVGKRYIERQTSGML